MTTSSPPLVCVTGGGGFIGSWLVKLLLSRGYAVHATVRDPRDAKNAFLTQLDGAPANLRLIKADMLDYGSVAAAFAGCQGVFHVASPVPEQKIVDPQKEMMEPTVKGTMNVLKACSDMKVLKLILVSSLSACCFTLDWPHDKVKDESCWSDKEFCKKTENWYALAKTEAEEMALEYGQKNGLHVITFCPGLVFGPLLQHVDVSTTGKVFIYIIKGGPDTMNKFYPIVDVRDVAEALLLLYDKARPSERYICSLDIIDLNDLLGIMKSMFPNYSYADKMVVADFNTAVTSDKLRNLGWNPRKLEETLADSVKSYEKSEVMVPAIKGTLNTLEVCSSMKVQKVVVVSSTSSVHFNPNWPQGKPKDESCWSDKKVCLENKLWYCLAKTVAEETALEYAEKNGLNVVTVCPCIVFGPQLQPVVNTSSELLVYVIKGGPNAMVNMLWHIVDVRDVADALLLVYEKPESSGRYISAPNYVSTIALLELLKKMYPNYNYVNCKTNVDRNSHVTPISSEKLKNLGWKPRALEETLLDSIEYYRKTGILQDVDGEGQACRLPDLFQFFHAAEE